MVRVGCSLRRQERRCKTQEECKNQKDGLHKTEKGYHKKQPDKEASLSGVKKPKRPTPCITSKTTRSPD
jgi:hypothetical protein